MLTAINGINWGDEGKGRMVDLLAQQYDIVVRYQGGNNAGHTVVNDMGKFALNLIPSGIFREEVVNILGNGVVIDLQHLCGEIGRLREAGVKISPKNLKISDKAIILMPYHQHLDVLEEERLGKNSYGSTRSGIAPVYSDKYMKKGLRMGELKTPDAMRKRLEGIVEWKNLTVVNGYGAEALSADELWNWLEQYGMPMADYVCDTSVFLDEAANAGKNILFEAQLGALRDIDFGIYPFTSSSNTIAAYAPIGAGIPNHKIDKSIGIMKAYSTCVGAGPFTCEMFGDEAEELRKAGGEYGAKTGRPRRVGGFDVVASKYGVFCQGADEIALTKLDVLSDLDEIPVCVAYLVNGEETTKFPVGEALDEAKPVYVKLPGWKCDISKCRKPEDLPEKARAYVDFIAEKVGCNIKYVSVGPERDAYIVMK